MYIARETTELSYKVIGESFGKNHAGAIEKAMELFHLYHELDFSKAVEWFNEERRKTSIIKMVMKQSNMSNAYVSEKTNISPSMIDALKNRRRDIRKLDLERSILLASTLNITVNTLLSN